jgi:hypothetical protein
MAEPGPLSADGAALLLRDLPRSITGVNPSWEDRAGVLERAWEKAEPGLAKTFDSVTAPVAETWRPIVLFNSTAVESGCRILVSQADATVSQTPVDDCRSPAISTDPQRFAAAAIDARDFLVDRTSLDGRSCVQEARAGSLTMATAAHLSARFTYVSPSGTMVGCSPRSLEMPSQDADAADRSPVLTSGIDGGYLENSGLQLLLQLWETLEPRVDRWNAESANGFKVIPIVVLTDNHYQSPAAQAAPRRRPELLVPLRGVNAPRVAMSTSIWEQHAVLRFAGAPPGMDDGVCWSNAALCRRVFRIAPDVRPQVSAPLGWSLSETSRENLDGQLTAQFKAAQAPQIGSLRGYDYRLLMHRLLDTSVG